MVALSEMRLGVSVPVGGSPTGTGGSPIPPYFGEYAGEIVGSAVVSQGRFALASGAAPDNNFARYDAHRDPGAAQWNS